MADVVAIVGELPPSIWLGWAVLLAWAVLQVLWYCRARVVVTAVRPSPAPAAPRPRPRVTLPAIDLSDVPQQPATSVEPAASPSTRSERPSILGLDLRPDSGAQ